MAKRKSKDRPAPPAAHASTGVGRANQKFRAKIRMYRQGLGDCFLITLPGKQGKPYYIMIDCGVILGTSGAAAKMQSVANDVLTTTAGHVDLLIVTHEHWDHLSGFIQAREFFSKLKIDEVWLAWTEDPKDDLANKLRGEHQKLRLALASACARMQFGGGGDSGLDSLMEFFGAAGQGTTTDALKFVRAFSDKPRFCHPQDHPLDLPGVNARLYILGPPHDEKMLKKFNPSQSHPETYGFANTYLDKIAPALTADIGTPFDPIAQIPWEAALQTTFFQKHYFGEDVESSEKDQSWRRIDTDWLDSSSSLALQLDSATNNTSLVLAIELGGGDVLLFAADAQVGNWLSWDDLSWHVNGKVVTGPELLERTVLYKTGHHGSHNATLQEKGLERMKNLKIALIPVDHAMALKKHWGNLPLPKLEKRLNEITNGAVLRIDKDVPAALAGKVKPNDLYYEVAI